MRHIIRYNTADDDNFTQAGMFYRLVRTSPHIRKRETKHAATVLLLAVCAVSWDS